LQTHGDIREAFTRALSDAQAVSTTSPRFDGEKAAPFRAQKQIIYGSIP